MPSRRIQFLPLCPPQHPPERALQSACLHPQKLHNPESRLYRNAAHKSSTTRSLLGASEKFRKFSPFCLSGTHSVDLITTKWKASLSDSLSLQVDSQTGREKNVFGLKLAFQHKLCEGHSEIQLESSHHKSYSDFRVRDSDSGILSVVSSQRKSYATSEGSKLIAVHEFLRGIAICSCSRRAEKMELRSQNGN